MCFLKSKYLLAVVGNVLFKVLIIMIVHSKIGNEAVPIADFFPYLEQDNPTLTAFTLNQLAQHIELGFSFPYFGVNYTKIVLESSGYVRFGEPYQTTSAQTQCTSELVYPGIFPLYSSIKLDKEGSITYGVLKNKTLLDQLSNDTCEYFSLNLSLTSCFVASYVNVANNYAPGRSTFQMIMATDGVHSFVIFHYNQLSNFSGSGLYAVGFTSHSKSVHLLNHWCPGDKTYKNNLNESNMLIPGKWMFRVDSKQLVSPIAVEFQQKLDKQPSIINLAGNRYLLYEIEYTGNIARSKLTLLDQHCVFQNLPGPQRFAEGIWLSGFSGILCKLPPRFETGLVEANLVIRVKVKSTILTKTVSISSFFEEPNTSMSDLVGVSVLEDFIQSPTSPISTNSGIISHCVCRYYTSQRSKHYKGLTIEPLIVPVFGNRPLLLQVTSLRNAPVKVICTFFELTNDFKRSEGILLSKDDSLIICPIPFLKTFGKINLEVQLIYDSKNTETVSGYFYGHRESDYNSEEFTSIEIYEEDEDMITLQQVSMNVSWKSSFLESEIAQYFREFTANKELVVYGYDGTDWSNGIVIASSSQNGTFKITLSEEVLVELFDKTLIPAFGIKETLVTNSGQNITGVTFQKMNKSFWLFQKLKNLSSYINLDSHFVSQCNDALKNEQCYIPTISTPCPESLRQAKSDWMFIEDKPVQMHDENLKSFTKAVPSRSGEGTKCLYGIDGNLTMLSHKQHYSSTFWRNHWSYYKTDFAPFLYCCGLKRDSVNCQNFCSTGRRHQNDGNYTYPNFALAVSTGKTFPIQGRSTRVEAVGEFWALKYTNQNETNQSIKSSYKSFKLQFRVEEYIDMNGESKGVPVITTVAIVDGENNNNFAIQISREYNQFQVQMNERDPHFIIPLSETAEEFSSNQTLYFDQAVIKHMPSVGQLLTTFKSGFSVKLYLAGDNEMGLSFIVSASERQLQNSVGLLAGSTVQDTETFNAWKVSETDTIFQYTVENPWLVYHRSDVPMRVPPLLNLQTGEIVNSGLEGVMDFLATGSESIGNSTKMIHDEFLLLKSAFKK